MSNLFCALEELFIVSNVCISPAFDVTCDWECFPINGFVFFSR